MSMRQSTNAPLEQFRQSTANSWRYEQITISASALKTITFMDSAPNMFLIQNSNKATLHVGLSAIPTLESCEFKVNPNSSKPFGRPTPCSELYIRNCSTVDITISLFSYYGTFDMSILTNNDVDISGTELQTKITGLEAPLPAGGNHIGSVNIVDGLPAGNNKVGKVELSNPLPNGTNNIGKVNVANSVEVTNDNFKQSRDFLSLIYATNDNVMTILNSFMKPDLSAIKKSLDEKIIIDYSSDISTLVENVANLLDRTPDITHTSYYEGTDAVKFTTTGDTILIKMLTNDGDAPITFGVDSTSVTLKSGETITDMLIHQQTFNVGGGSKRVIVQAKDVTREV